MKENNYLSVVKFDSAKIISNNYELIQLCLEIINSHKTESEQSSYIDTLLDLNSRIYLNNENARIYVLSRFNEPVSFTLICGNDSPAIEMVFTQAGYENCGYAEYLLKNAIEDLMTEEKIFNLQFASTENGSFKSVIKCVAKELQLPSPVKEKQNVILQLTKINERECI